MLIFCSGMLRSGSALQYNLVCSILSLFYPCVRHGRWEPKSRFTLNQLNAWANDNFKFHVIKSARYPEEFQLAKIGAAKILYIHRDLRDIAVAAKYKWKIEGDELFLILNRAVASYEEMIINGGKNSKWCLIQKYEDVYTNMSGAIEEISQYLNLKLTKQQIDFVINECSLEKMIPLTTSQYLRYSEFLRVHLGKIADLIKPILPGSLKKSLGLRKYYLRILPKVDSKSCIALRHIEPTKGLPGAWQNELSEFEAEKIKSDFVRYLSTCNYI